MFSGSKTKSGAVVLHQTFPPECHIPARREGRSQNRRGAYYTRLGYEIPSWLELEGGESPALVFFFFLNKYDTPLPHCTDGSSGWHQLLACTWNYCSVCMVCLHCFPQQLLVVTALIN